MRNLTSPTVNLNPQFSLKELTSKSVGDNASGRKDMAVSQRIRVIVFVLRHKSVDSRRAGFNL